MKKRYIIFISFFLICLFLFAGTVNAAQLSKSYVVCHDANVLKGLRIVGYVIMVLKILVPIILIVTSMYTLFKAVLDGNDNATRDAVNLLIKKFFTGAVLFFIPTLIYAFFGAVSGYDKTKTKFSDCGKCVTSVKNCNTLIDKYK